MARKRRGRKGLRVGQSKLSMRKVRGQRRLAKVTRKSRKRYSVKFVSKKYTKGKGKWHRTSRSSYARDSAIRAKHRRKPSAPTWTGDLKGSRI